MGPNRNNYSQNPNAYGHNNTNNNNNNGAQQEQSHFQNNSQQHRDRMAAFNKCLDDGKLCWHPESLEFYNVPNDILHNQYGMLGLILQTALPRNQRVLTDGIDLTTLGVPTSSQIESRKNTLFFGGPFNEEPKKLQDIEIDPVKSYDNITRSHLSTVTPEKFGENLLFWIYFNYPNDVISLACACVLKRKGWEYWKLGREISFFGLEFFDGYSCLIFFNIS